MTSSAAPSIRVRNVQTNASGKRPGAVVRDHWTRGSWVCPLAAFPHLPPPEALCLVFYSGATPPPVPARKRVWATPE